MKIDNNGISFFTEVHQRNSSKPDLILLHGFMGSGRSFRLLIPHLLPFCNPITLDLAGHGKTRGASDISRFKLEQQLDDLKTIIRNLQLSRPILHGYSMGGRLALRLALSHPNQLSGLILESTNYGLINPAVMEQRIATDEQRARAIETDYEAFLKKWKTLPLFQSSEGTPQKHSAFYDAIQQSQNPRQMANSLRGFGTAQMPAVKKQLDQLQLPALLLAGEDDEKYVRLMKEMADLIPNSRLETVSGAAHRIHLDNPELYAQHLKNFITL